MIKRNKKGISLATKDAIAGYLFSLPFIIGFIFLFLSPMILYFVMSFSKLSLDDTGMVFKFVGLSNFYEAIFVQSDFIQKLIASISDLLISFPSVILYSFFIANLLNQKFRGRAFARAVFFLPVIVASGVAAIGQNDALTSSAISAISGTSGSSGDSLNLTKTLMDVLGASFDPKFFAAISNLVSKIYEIAMASGVQILIFLAGLQTISPSLYEASSIEGATSWENFWKITLPMISPLILVNSVYTIVDSMGKSTNSIIDMLYKLSISESKFGLSSAMGSIYFILIFAVLGIVIFAISKMVFYEDR